MTNRRSRNTFDRTLIPEEIRGTWEGYQEARKGLAEWAKDQGFAIMTIRSSPNAPRGDAKMIIGCRHSLTPRCTDERPENENVVKTFVANDQGGVTETRVSTSRKKDSQRFDCPFRINVRPVPDVTSTEWHITKIELSHNHPMALEPSSYPMNRRMNEAQHEAAVGMIQSLANNRSIVSYLNTKMGAMVQSKDISNKRRQVFANDKDKSMRKLIDELDNHGYRVRYTTIGNGNKTHLQGLFFAHTSAIEIARELPDAIIIDATYKTNAYRLPFIQVIGTGNIGIPHLKSFYIAGAWVAQETNEMYAWTMESLRDVAWPDDQPAKPKVIVTDREVALMNALDNVFPDARKLNCTAHLRRNFREDLRREFKTEDDYEELEQALNYLMASNHEDKRIKMQVIADMGFEDEAKRLYNEAADKSNNPEKVKNYLTK